MRRIVSPALILALAALVSVLLVACQAAAPAPTPTPKVEPTSTPAPTATKPPATATPTVAPTATPSPTAKPATPTAKPVAAPTSGVLGALAGGDAAFGEMEKAMAEAMPTMMAEALPTIMAMMPTAPPVPKGQPANLSQSDLAGRWDGWLTIEAAKLDGATPEQQQACDQQLKMIKGRQLPIAMEFQPKAANAGLVIMINKNSSISSRTTTTIEEKQEPVPYKYQGGTLSIVPPAQEESGAFEGKTLKTDTGYAITGTWKSSSPEGLSPSADDPLGQAFIEGTWTVMKSR